MSGATEYICPICFAAVHQEPLEVRIEKRANGSVFCEPPSAIAARIERILERHMKDVHSMTSEQAVAYLDAL